MLVVSQVDVIRCSLCREENDRRKHRVINYDVERKPLQRSDNKRELKIRNYYLSELVNNCGFQSDHEIHCCRRLYVVYI